MKNITDILFASDKRKKALLLLLDGPKEMDALLASLGTTRAALLPQTKILKEGNLIAKSNDTYSLTTTGKVIVKEMEHFLNTAEIFAGDNGYLGTHYIDFIPENLLKMIPELGPCEVIDIPIDRLFDSEWKDIDSEIGPNYWFEITSALHPTFYEFYIGMTDYVTEVAIIFSSEVYEKAKQEYGDKLKELLDLDLISLYLYPHHLDFVSFTMNKGSLKFNLLTKEKHPDNKRVIFSGSEAFEWGKEFFNHYINLSKPIIESE